MPISFKKIEFYHATIICVACFVVFLWSLCPSQNFTFLLMIKTLSLNNNIRHINFIICFFKEKMSKNSKFYTHQLKNMNQYYILEEYFKVDENFIIK